MKNNLCTLFDKNYSYRGIALYNSIKKNCDNFTLWILCMDNETFKILNKLNLDNTKLLKLSDIEDKVLISLKETREVSEFSWTCKSYLLEYIFINNENISSIIYLDSDTYFFSSPNKLFKNLKNNSIIITPHNFPSETIHWENTIGKYNAGVIILKNNKTARKCLSYWKKQCVKECTKEKAGDQLYLNEWVNLYSNVYEIKDKGVNLGPWSLQNYKITNKNNKIYIDNDLLTLFHFHGLKIFSKEYFYPASNYNLQKKIVKLIYKPYYNELKKVISDIKLINKDFNFGIVKKPSLYNRIKKIVRNLIK